jgi:hypothetical protein
MYCNPRFFYYDVDVSFRIICPIFQFSVIRARSTLRRHVQCRSMLDAAGCAASCRRSAFHDADARLGSAFHDADARWTPSLARSLAPLPPRSPAVHAAPRLPAPRPIPVAAQVRALQDRAYADMRGDQGGREGRRERPRGGGTRKGRDGGGGLELTPSPPPLPLAWLISMGGGRGGRVGER